MKNGPYILVKAPFNYTGRKYRGKYIYEHHLVWWQNTGEVLERGEVIHHVNGDKTDNCFNNLEKHTNSAHVQLHNPKQRLTWLSLCCDLCGAFFWRRPNQVMSKIKNGQKRFYCCRSHQVTHQQKRRWAKRKRSLSSVP